MPGWTAWLDLQWRWPWALALVLLPLVLEVWARRRRRRLASYADAPLRPWAVHAQAADTGTRLRRVAAALAWALLAVAAAGPRLPLAGPDEGVPGARAPHVVDVMVVLDVSASMAATDVVPDRLTRAKLELQDLLRRVHGERLGLLVFAGQAGVLLPPTDDAALFAHALQQAGPELLDTPGTDLARALALAREQLQRGDRAHARAARAVLLVGDAHEDSLQGAAGAAARSAVDALRAADIPLYVLVTASEAGGMFELPQAAGGRRALRADGTPVLSRPALAAYGDFARGSGGALSLARDGDADWDRLYDGGLARLPGAPVPAATAQGWRELFVGPLALALLLLAWAALPARAVSAAVLPVVLVALSCGALAPAPARAAAPVPPELAAAQAWRAGHWAQALPLFERQGGYAGHMGAGAAAWRLREFGRAAGHFGQALLLARTAGERDDALYNLGNAHYGLGQWQTAAEAWAAVLRSRPHDRQASANLAQAEKEIARRAGTPLRTDLRGRLGFAAEGYVSPDGMVRPSEEEMPLPEREAGARTAQQAAGDARLREPPQALAQAAAAPGARQLQSGLLKLERLQDRPRTLWRGLLRQDRQPTTVQDAGAPW